MPTVSSSESAYLDYSDRLAQLEESMQNQARKQEESHEQEIKRLQASHQSDLKRRSDETDRAINEAKKNGWDALTREKDRQRSEVAMKNSELYDRYGRVRSNELETLHHDLNMARDALTLQDKSFKAKNADGGSIRQQEAIDAEKVRLESTIRGEHESRNHELTQLREQVRDMSHFKDQYIKDKAHGREESIREYEDDHRAEMKTLNERYQKEFEGLHRDIKDRDNYYTRVNAENLRDKEQVYTELLNRDKVEHRRDLRDADAAFEKHRKHLEVRDQRVAERHHVDYEKLTEAYRRQQLEALEKQDRVFNKEYGHQRASHKAEVERLEQQIQQRSSTTDLNAIPRALEEKIVEKVRAEDQKLFDVERKRNEDRTLASYLAAEKNMASVLSETQAEKASVYRSQTADRQIERNELLQHIAEVELQRQISLRDQDQSHTRQNDERERVFATALDRQRRDYDEMFESVKADGENQLRAVRQEAEFSSKMAQRAFSIRQNEIIREYEKRLANQKTDFEGSMLEMKTQAEASLREVERRSRKAYDEQARSYEQRIAQLEAQYSEREKTAMANHQDELEKMKRSNALLISKKS